MAKHDLGPLGLVDESVLRQLRNTQRQVQFQRQQGQSGVDFAAQNLGAASGQALGAAIRAALGKAGLVKDTALDNAKAVTRAKNAAAKRTDEGLKELPEGVEGPAQKLPTDPTERRILEREIFIDELRAEGQNTAADSVLGQVIDMREAQAKFKKLQGEVNLGAEKLKEAKFEQNARETGTREKAEILNLQGSRAQLDPTTPEGAQRIDELNQRINKINEPSKGTTEFDLPLGEVFTRKLRTELVENSDARDRFTEQSRTFRPEFLTVQTKVKNWLLNQGGIVGLEVPEAEKAQLTAFNQFRQQTNESFNLYVKRITGAQMSEVEVVRLRGAFPNLNDPPQVYADKLFNARRMIEAMRLRSLDTLNEKTAGAQLKVRTTELKSWFARAEREMQRQDVADL